jgi:hypothetical protein
MRETPVYSAKHAPKVPGYLNATEKQRRLFQRSGGLNNMWIIDFDVHGDRSKRPPCNDNAIGMAGPGTYAADDPRLKHLFRMSDGDGDIAYYGRCDTNDDDNAFTPLDDFGGPNYGCTTIEYFNRDTGQWEEL